MTGPESFPSHPDAKMVAVVAEALADERPSVIRYELMTRNLEVPESIEEQRSALAAVYLTESQAKREQT